MKILSVAISICFKKYSKMKHLTLLFLLLLINEYLLSQVKFKPKIVIPMIVSGAADGIDENIKFHKVGQRHSF